MCPCTHTHVPSLQYFSKVFPRLIIIFRSFYCALLFFILVFSSVLIALRASLSLSIQIKKNTDSAFLENHKHTFRYFCLLVLILGFNNGEILLLLFSTLFLFSLKCSRTVENLETISFPFIQIFLSNKSVKLKKILLAFALYLLCNM